MKKLLFIIAALLITMITPAQTKQDYKNYIEYCNTETPDTVWQVGNVKTKLIPVYSDSGELIKYSYGNTSDTVWVDVECKSHLVDHGTYNYTSTGIIFNDWGNSSLTYDTISNWRPGPILSSMIDNQHQTDIKYEVKRKYVCSVKNEKPSREGFYIWKWEQISK